MTSPLLIRPVRHGDDRGWFTEVYSAPAFAARGIADAFVQDNHSFSAPRLTLRGLHYQTPPRAQAKLVRCIRGSILDVAVDIRRGSPTYGKWRSTVLSAENGHQLYVPVGYAHGFLTLEADCEVTYKVSDVYAPECDGGLKWDDPAIGIDWPTGGAAPVLSVKDAGLPSLADFASPFDYDDIPLGDLD